MRRLLLALALLPIFASPAHAHRLKVFATVEDGAIDGYGFFIGGGRPQTATFIVQDGAGAELFRGRTDIEGGFTWRPDHGGDFVVVIDAGDGHMAQAKIAASRFADYEGEIIAPALAGETADAGAPVDPAAPDDLARMIDASVDRAVSRQIRPLLEAYEAADGDVRFNDVVGGIGMIVGLAGMAMWGLARRRERNQTPGDRA
ncbi:MAG: cobalamin biosynthesis protein CbiM [Bauldia sp.]